MRKAIEQKAEIVSKIKNRFDDAEALIIFEYQGLSVPALEEMRRELGEHNAHLQIYKNRLFRRAVAQGNYATLADSLMGPNAFVFTATEPHNVLQTLAKFAKTYKKIFKFKAGIIDQKLLSGAEVAAIAFLPTKPEMIAMFANALLYPLRSFMMAVKAVAEKNQAGASPAAG